MQLDNPVPGQTGLTKVEDYRARADECERMAAEARDPDAKRWFLRAAEEWRKLASDTISN